MGMDVRGSDGEKLGTVGEIMAIPGDEAFIMVDQGGVLGIGSKHLWIPLEEISQVTEGRHITLSCTKEEADRQYDRKPQTPTIPPEGGSNDSLQ